jgi:Na+/phosphate symporter
MPRTQVDADEDARYHEILKMSAKLLEMVQILEGAFRKQDPTSLGVADRLGREVHRHEKALMETLVTVADAATRPPSEEVTVYVPMHLDRVGNNLESLAGAVRTMIADGILFTDRAMREVNSLLEMMIELLECVHDAVRTRNRALIRNILMVSKQCESMANDFALFHQQRLIEGVCQPRASSLYLAIFDYLKGIEWHVRQIAEKLAPAPLSDMEPARGAHERLKPA